jgi:ubiquinone biosynthesis protein UbiJ
MLHKLQTALAPAVLERATLFVNHVLGSEPAALERTRPHAQRTVVVELDRWPGIVPAPGPLAWRVTPAGLLEWCGAERIDVPDLRLVADAANPARLALQIVLGELPPVQVAGDAQLATDVNWLMHNLRWDTAGDLERLVGPAPAHLLAQAGGALVKALRQAMAQADAWAQRLRGGAS